MTAKPAKARKKAPRIIMTRAPGFAVIAASMDRHQDQLGTEGLAPARLKAWRLAGYALLALSLAPCLLRWNASVALAAWLGLLTFAALALRSEEHTSELQSQSNLV